MTAMVMVTLWAAIGAFIGSGIGTFYVLRVVAVKLQQLLEGRISVLLEERPEEEQ